MESLQMYCGKVNCAKKLSFLQRSSYICTKCNLSFCSPECLDWKFHNCVYKEQFLKDKKEGQYKKMPKIVNEKIQKI